MLWAGARVSSPYLGSWRWKLVVGPCTIVKLRLWNYQTKACVSKNQELLWWSFACWRRRHARKVFYVHQTFTRRETLTLWRQVLPIYRIRWDGGPTPLFPHGVTSCGCCWMLRLSYIASFWRCNLSMMARIFAMALGSMLPLVFFCVRDCSL